MRPDFPIVYAMTLSLCLAVLSGCTVGPDYVRPTTAQPQVYREMPDDPADAADWRPAAPGLPDAGPWWKAFEDPLLDMLMVDVGRANQNIQSSLASLRQARAAVREARSAFFPLVSVSGGVSRERTATSTSVENIHTAALQASWEPDLWGATRRDVESSVAQAEAQAADLGAVILSMRAELALNYFQARTYDEMLVLYAKTVLAYRRFLEITENQYQAGIATKADVAQARAQLKAAQAQQQDIELQRRQTENAIANLLGLPPSGFNLTPARLNAHLPRIDAGVPSALLERRPDVATAERQAAAANAAIGVAESAFFPVLSIPASGGYSSTTFRKWFTSPHEVWSVGPALALTLFDGGARRARTDQAMAAWEAAVANYRQTVLQAFNDVENALVSIRLLEKEATMQEEALSASREAESMLLDQYQSGTVTFLDVATAQAASLSNARTLAQVQGSRFAAAVTLIRSLGGGWDSRQLAADGTTLPGQQDAAAGQDEKPQDK